MRSNDGRFLSGLLGILLVVFGCSPQSPPDIPAPSERVVDVPRLDYNLLGSWNISGVDVAGNNWEGSTLNFTSQIATGTSYDVGGFFLWNGSNGSYGRENFKGTVSSEGAVYLQGTENVPPFNNIVIGIYRAQFKPEDNMLANGSWGGFAVVPSDSWSALKGSSKLPARLFFSIAYINETTDAPMSFIRAAETWEREVNTEYAFDKKAGDIFLKARIRESADFISAWETIAQTLEQNKNAMAVEGALFTHSTWPWPDSGLEFAKPLSPDFGEIRPQIDNTLLEDQISSLPKLRWDKEGLLTLFGCNTAEARLPNGWIPAKVFAQIQGVATLGEPGFTAFSIDKDKYVSIEQQPNPTTVYLGSYFRGANFPITGNPRMKQVRFRP